MSVNLSALSSLSSTLLSGIILVNPQRNIGYQPQNAPMSPGMGPLEGQSDNFIFNYEGEQSLILESDITDHYVEDNTSINDQIALRPEVVTTHGYIGELTDIAPPLLVPLRIAASKLTGIGAYAPSLSVTALRAYNTAILNYSSASQLINSAVDAWDSLTGETQNKQQKAFVKFYGFWKQRTLFTIQTPWNIMNNMAIKSLRAIQDPDTTMITDFEITFKKMNFSTTMTTGGLQAGQGRFNNQAAPEIKLGSTSPFLGTNVSMNSFSLLGGSS